MEIRFRPGGPVSRAFMLDDSFVRGIRGHVGSGKSVLCCMELMRRAMEQEPDAGGVRRSRWAIIRNTFPQLKTTTIKTWLEWFPEDRFGRINWGSPVTHRIRLNMGNTELDAEFIFLPLDTEADLRKLLSLELTGAFINEAREVPKAILDGVTQRVGRYPSARDGGPGPTWVGVVMDTNSPGKEHWWAIMSGEVPAPDWMSATERMLLVKPQGWRFFAQPPAMLPVKNGKGDIEGYEPNPARENQTVKDDYFIKMLPGKTPEWINVYIGNEYGDVFDGRPVYPMFARRLHVSRERLYPFEGHPIYVGIDFGLTPAATFGQFVRGRHFVLREIVATGMGITRFIPLLREMMTGEFPGYEFRVYGDPAGDTRAQTDERTPFMLLRAADIKAVPAPTNDPVIRQGAVEQGLMGLVDGEPSYLVSPCCTTLIRGFEGGYRLLEGGGVDKNEFSHVHDAEQYRMLGTGAGRALVNGSKPASATVLPSGFSPRSVSRLQGLPSAATKVSFRSLR